MNQQSVKNSPCFVPGTLLLPNESVSLQQWACPAANRFEDQPEVWRELEAARLGAPSVQEMLVPDAFLNKVETQQRLRQTVQKMPELERLVLTKQVNGFVYVERTLPDGSVRQGLVGLVDLEQYAFSDHADTPVRAPLALTAHQVLPRVERLEQARLQSSHILLLADDVENRLFAPLKGLCEEKPLYEGMLCYGGGSVKGWAVEDAPRLQAIADAFAVLADPARFAERWGQQDAAPVVLAPVSGGEDLAAAKAYWMMLKEELSEEEQKTHPARFCLAEVCSAHSDAVCLAPVHRLVMGVQGLPLLVNFKQWCAQQGILLRQAEEGKALGPRLRFVYGSWKQDVVPALDARYPLAVGLFDAFLADYLQQNPMCSVDHLCNEAELRELAADGNCGVMLPDVTNNDLFLGLASGGFLPRSPFVMDASQQRYELECRRIESL